MDFTFFKNKYAVSEYENIFLNSGILKLLILGGSVDLQKFPAARISPALRLSNRKRISIRTRFMSQIKMTLFITKLLIGLDKIISATTTKETWINYAKVPPEMLIKRTVLKENKE